MNKILLTASAISLVLAASYAKAEESTGDRIDKLEQEIQLLKRQQEVSTEKSAAASEKSATVEIGKKGLAIASPDKKYELNIHGVFQFDNRDYLNDKNDTARNDTLVRKARPVITFKAGDALLYFMPDFAGTSSTPNNTKIFDAYAEYKLSDAFKVRAGKFKPPISLEELQGDADTLFTERGYAAELAPSRDIGLQLSGDIVPDVLEYQVGVFDGAPDLGNNDGDGDEKKDFAGRIFAKPFRNSDIVQLQGLGVGVGGSIGERKGNSTNSIVSTSSDYVTPGQVTFFHLNSGTFADGEQWRLSPQAYWFSGNKGILAEYGISDQHITNGTRKGELNNTAWQITGSYVLTGEDSNFSGGVKPAEDFNIKNGTWGAWELVARAGQLKIDDAAFPDFASTSTSAKSATSYGLGVSWYLSENLKAAVNYNYTIFDGGQAGGADRPEEDSILSRVQYRF